MDSLTQLVLGAATGEAVLGKKLGNKAVLWGAAAGTLPDLDVIPGMFFDTPDRLLFHRGFSHSLAFVVLATLIFTWLFSRFYKSKGISKKQWAWFFGLIFFVSALIDAFTTYGTQLLWPWKHRFEFNTIFVVDPIFTLPLLITTIWLVFYNKNSQTRKRINRTGLIISAVYLALTVVNKQFIDTIFRKSLERQNINYVDFRTNPTPMNQVLWSAVVKTEDGFYTGYYSYFDPDQNIRFEFEPQNRELISPVEFYKPVEKILRFTKGYFTVEKKDEGFLINDLRFGQIRNWEKETWQYIFQYEAIIERGQVQVREVDKGFGQDTGELINQLWQRIKGREF